MVGHWPPLPPGAWVLAEVKTPWRLSPPEPLLGDQSLKVSKKFLTMTTSMISAAVTMRPSLAVSHHYYYITLTARIFLIPLFCALAALIAVSSSMSLRSMIARRFSNCTPRTNRWLKILIYGWLPNALPAFLAPT